MDWHQAQDYCWSELEYAAHLVEILDSDENDYLAQKLDEYDHVSGWREWGIGLVNLGGKSNPRWIWSYSLQPSNFTKFYSLDDGTTFKDAVVMSNLFHDYDYDYEYQDYYWTYVSLSHQFYPVCQYKPVQPNSATTVAPTATCNCKRNPGIAGGLHQKRCPRTAGVLFRRCPHDISQRSHTLT